MPDTVTLRDSQGRAFGVPQEQVSSYLSQGFRPESDEESIGRTTEDTFREQHGGIGGAIVSGVAGGLSGLTLGGSDLALGALGAGRTLQHIEAEHPYAAGAGQILGALAPAVLTGGAAAGEEAAGLGARILANTPAGLAGRAGHAISGLGEGAGLLGKTIAGAAGAGAEGALYGGGQYLTETALEDKPLSAEGFIAGIGHGALFGAPIGAAATLASGTLQRARALFPRSEVSAAAAAGVKEQASGALAQAVRDGDAMAQAAERKLSDVDARAAQAQAGEQVTRRVFGGADQQAMADQVTGAVDRKAVAEALEGYQQARQQFDDWIATEADPELEQALLGLRPGELQTPAIGAPPVPVGEFGAPGQRGIKSPEELAAAAAGERSDPRFAGGTPQGAQPETAVLRGPGGPLDAIGPTPAAEPTAAPARLDDVRPTPGGEGTAVGRRPAQVTESAESAEAPAAGGRISVERIGRPTAGRFEARMSDGSVRELGKAEIDTWVNEQLPLGFSRGNLETHRNFTIEHGVPASQADIAPNSLYVVRPSELADRGILGNKIRPDDLKSVQQGFADGKRLFPITVDIAPNGELAIDDGNHRLLAKAAEGDKPVAVQFRPSSAPKVRGEAYDPNVPIADRLRDAIRDARGAAGKGTAAGRAGSAEATGIPDHATIKAHETKHDDYLERTVSAREIAARGYYEPPGGNTDAVRMGNARKAIKDGQREAIKLNISPTGKITTTDGRHRLQAAIEADAQIKVKWSTGSEPAPSDVLRHGSRASSAEAVAPMSAQEYKAFTEYTHDQLTSDEYKAFLRYSGSPDFKEVNKILRSGEEVPRRLLPTMEAIDSGVAKSTAPRSMVVYRGARDAPSLGPLRNLRAGDAFEDAGFGSTSVDMSTAERFSRHDEPGKAAGVVMEISVPAGFPALPVPSNTYGKFENEILLPRGSKYVVTGVDVQPDGGRVIKMTVQEARASSLTTSESLPAEFDLGGVNEHGVRILNDTADLRRGLPEFEALDPDRAQDIAYLVRPSDLSKAGIFEEAGARELSSSGGLTPTVELNMRSDGSLYITAGGNVLRDAAESGDRAILASVWPGHSNIDHKFTDISASLRKSEGRSAPASSTLTGQLRGTAAKVDEGQTIGQIGAEAPARAEYVTARAAKQRAAAEHFRAKATGAKYEASPMAAAERDAQGEARDLFFANLRAPKTRDAYVAANIGRAMREEGGSHAAALAKVEREWAARAGTGDATTSFKPEDLGLDFHPETRTYSDPAAAARNAIPADEMATGVRPGATLEPEVGDTTMGRILAKHGLSGGTAEPDALAARILRNESKPVGIAPASPVSDAAVSGDGKLAPPMTKAEIAAQRARFREVAPEQRAAKAIMRHNGKNVDMGPSLARGARAIGGLEEASAKLTEVLGSEAPPSAVENAKAFRAATGQANERAAASSAKAAADLKTRLPTEMSSVATGQLPAPLAELKRAIRDGGIPASAAEYSARREAMGMPSATEAPRGRVSRAPLPLGGAEPSSPGVGGKLADVGSALEVLRAIGAHVPAISHIPVIGPVLGLWLKARAVMGILGRKGGSIGKSTEGVIAAKAAATRDRIVAATGAILDGASKGAGKAAHLAGAAALLGGQLFPGGEKPKSDKPRDLYQARLDEIVRAQSPGAIDQAIAQRYPTSDPDLHDAVVAQVRRGIAFLDSKAPKQTVLPGVLPGDGTWKPSMAAIEEFGKYVHAVNDPVSVLEDLAKGHVYAEGAETLKTVYPQLYQYAQKELLQAAPAMAKTLPYPRRVMISILYGIPVDGTLSPSHAQYLQVPSQSAPAGKAPTISGPLRLGQQTMSPLDQRASGA